MKKLLIILTALALTTNAFSMNMSSSESQNTKSDNDKSITDKFGNESKDSKTERNSYTNAVENSKANARAIVKLEQTDILEKFEMLEATNKNKGFWKKCSVVSNPKLNSDFGITAEDSDYDVIDTNLASLIEQASKANSSVRKIISSKNERALKEYMNCLLKYSVVAAQSLIDGRFTTKITDESLLRLDKSATKNLIKATCRFAGNSNTIQCQSLKVILDYEPVLMDKQISYYSKDKFMNLSGTNTYTVTDNESIRGEEGTSNERTESNSISQDNSTSKKYSSGTTVDNKSEMSAQSFFSKLF